MANIRKDPNKFQSWCLEKGYTASYVATVLGISKYAIFAYFAGTRLPSRKTMQLMEERLGIDTKEMF